MSMIDKNLGNATKLMGKFWSIIDISLHECYFLYRQKWISVDV